MAILRNWKETIGSLAILVTLYLWYFDKITQEKAIFGIILLVAGGFVSNTIDLIDLFKYIGNFNKKPTNDKE
jgi:lipoprotein signal peptidase